MEKKQLTKITAVILVSVLIDITFHIATSAFSTMPENPSYSSLAALLGLEITATLWALLAFSGAACVFYRVQANIPGTGLMKGLRYGTAISLLWLFAMLEGVPLFGNPVINEFVTGLSDAIPVLLMGILLGLFIAGKEEKSQLKELPLSRKVRVIFIITGTFLLGRYVAYFTGAIQSGFQRSPVYTFLWTLFMGACIGMVSILLGNVGNSMSLKSTAARFAFLAFGVNWAAFLVFMPLSFSGYLTDVLSRIVLDILLAAIGYYFAFSSKTEYLKDVINSKTGLKQRKVCLREKG